MLRAGKFLKGDTSFTQEIPNFYSRGTQLSVKGYIIENQVVFKVRQGVNNLQSRGIQRSLKGVHNIHSRGTQLSFKG